MTIDPKILDSIDTALALLPRAMNTDKARVMMYAIGLQESRFEDRQQIVRDKPVGPAKGFWQFERGGGCKGVVNHAASRYWMHQVCAARGVPFNATAIWHAVKTDDVLAAAAARLLLFTDPRKLPGLLSPSEGWNLYLRTWRPGKPHRKTWDAFHAQAVLTMIERGET